MMTAVFWGMTPCILVQVYTSFREEDISSINRAHEILDSERERKFFSFVKCPHPVWGPSCLVLILSGAHPAWGPIPSGAHPVWGSFCLGPILSGDHPAWGPSCLGLILSGAHPVWGPSCLGPILSGAHPVWGPSRLFLKVPGGSFKER